MSRTIGNSPKIKTMTADNCLSHVCLTYDTVIDKLFYLNEQILQRAKILNPSSRKIKISSAPN